MNPVARITRCIVSYFWSSNLRVEAAMVQAAQAAHQNSLEVQAVAADRLRAELHLLEASLRGSAQPSSPPSKRVPLR